MNITEIAIRIVVAFAVLFILTKIMGRKEISQLTFFNFVSAISVGTIAGSLAVNQSLSISGGVFALVGWSLLTILMGIANIKSKTAQKIFTGQPKIVIKQGKILEDELREVRLGLESLNTMLRKKNIFSIADVEYAILETDGKLSVMKKETKQPLTKSDMQTQMVKTNVFPIATAVISDGQINRANLSKLNLDETWLQQQLEGAGINDISDVFYGELQQDGTLYLDQRNDMLH